MKNKYTNRKLEPLILLVMLGVTMTATVSADESFLSKPNFTDLEDGDITLARSERGGAGIHISLMSPSGLNGNSQTGYVLTSNALLKPDVYLSLRFPW